MNPPVSMIYFTLLAGAAQGLLLALVGVDVAVRAGQLPPPPASLYVAATVVVEVLGAAGLAAATFHLGHPLRAWRAVAMWRTSWLSREVIVLPAFLAAVLWWGTAHALGLATAAPGFVAAALALALFLCTGMIYAAVSVMREWATPLTPLNFALMGTASGLVGATALAGFVQPALAHTLAPAAAGATLLAAAARGAAAWRNAKLVAAITPQSAIGIRHPQIRPVPLGMPGGNFNTREFQHGRPPALLQRLRWLALGAGFLLPALGLAFGAAAALPLFAVQLLGLAAERWLFFAEARHPQNLYFRPGA
jgi:sulfite dehydrogenase (quinone) subunit SoeC